MLVFLLYVTRFNLIPYDVDVVITVSPGLFMPKTQSMQELVLDYPQMITVCANGQPLFPNMLIAH